MQKHTSDVSVIISAYNCEKYIEEAINSVILQTLQVAEIVIVDDCSKDRTVQIIKNIQKTYTGNIQIRLIQNESNLGAARTRNRGILESRHRYISFLDADDVWDINKNKYEYNFMRNNGYAFCFTSYCFGDENARSTGRVVRVPRDIAYKEALSRTIIFTSTVMIDTKLIDRNIIKMPNIPSEDTATWWNILKQGYIGHGININLVIYRRTSGTLSSNKKEAIRRIWNLYTVQEKLDKKDAALYLSEWAIRASLRRLIKREPNGKYN